MDINDFKNKTEKEVLELLSACSLVEIAAIVHGSFTKLKKYSYVIRRDYNYVSTINFSYTNIRDYASRVYPLLDDDRPNIYKNNEVVRKLEDMADNDAIEYRINTNNKATEDIVRTLTTYGFNISEINTAE